jgi:hypothetical protein
MGIELVEETIGRLRNQLDREPTEDEVRAARNELIRRAYAAMAIADVQLREEAENSSRPPKSE